MDSHAPLLTLTSKTNDVHYDIKPSIDGFALKLDLDSEATNSALVSQEPGVNTGMAVLVTHLHWRWMTKPQSLLKFIALL
jgi:hypothetical protein